MPKRPDGARGSSHARHISPAGREMLRAIRVVLDADAVFTGSNAQAAALAGIPEADAARVLSHLAAMKLITLRRASSKSTGDSKQ